MPTKNPHSNFIIALSYIPVCIAPFHCLASCSHPLPRQVWFILQGILVYFLTRGSRDLEDSRWVVALFMPASSSQTLLSVTFSRLQFQETLVLITGFLLHLFSIIKPQSPNLAQRLAPTLNQVTFSRLWEAEYYFSEQAGHEEEGNLTPVLEAFLFSHYCRQCSVLNRPLLSKSKDYLQSTYWQVHIPIECHLATVT